VRSNTVKRDRACEARGKAIQEAPIATKSEGFDEQYYSSCPISSHSFFRCCQVYSIKEFWVAIASTADHFT